MNPDDDRALTAYLWDPAAPPIADVADVEGRLAPLRFDAGRHPLDLPAAPSSIRVFRTHAFLALAAASVAIAFLTLAAFWSWRSSWTAGSPWRVVIDSTAAGGTTTPTWLRVDLPLQLGDRTSARIDIARIGELHAAPGSTITLAETKSARHRVVLTQGTVSVRVWAPPGQFAFRTPAGSVIDLGCIFDLSVGPDGAARVRVDTGWVQLDNDWGESLVPAGASSEMTAEARPRVPIYDDSSAVFAAAVRQREQGTDEIARARALDVVIRTARVHDVYTLLMLANASDRPARRALLDRAAQLVPPPAGITVDDVDGNRALVWEWTKGLGLPPVKSWWRNWRDALPWRH